MADINTNIDDIKEKIENVTDLFYRQLNDLAYNKLNELLVGITELIKNLEAIDSDYSKGVIIDLTSILMQCLEAMENKDTVLLADIMQYDLTEKIDEINSNI